jgi:hypothetical protein
MRLIITDLTEMSPGNFCVAGWDAQAQRMVRPLPNGANWTQALLQQSGIAPGATVQFHALNQPHASVYPQHTEDTRIDAANITLISVGPINWFAPNAPPTQPRLAQAFGNALAFNSEWNGVRQGVHVPIGTQVSSLGAILIPSVGIELNEEVYNGKTSLKAVLNDGAHRYKVAVSSLALKVAWRNGGVAAATQALPQTAQIHVRVGLARAFGNPADKCYVMVNGVHG